MQRVLSGHPEAARRFWRVALVRGIIAILFGLLAIFWPHLTFFLLLYIFGAFALIEGGLLIATAFAQKRAVAERRSFVQREYPPQRETAYQANAPYQSETLPPRDPAYQAELYMRPTNWMLLLGEGVVSIICGLLCFFVPLAVGILALYIIAVWALIEGIGALMQIRTRGWVMGVIGILAIILALILFFNPIGVIRSFLWIIGLFALIMGVLMVLWSLYMIYQTARQQRPEEAI